jgi:outer membrane immunogenic protein
LALAVATGASAADLPAKAPPAAVAAWSWAGAYVGMSAGAARPRTGYFDLGSDCCQLAFPPGEFFAFSNWRATVGLQAGYNWQFGNWVVGVEADVNWIDGKSTNAPANGQLFTPFMNADVSWFATARGRLGWAVGRGLFYGTGGVLVARLSNQWGLFNTSQTPPFSYEETRATWVAGLGVEYMVTQNWTFRIEGLHSDFGFSPIQTLTGFGATYQSRFTNRLTVLRGGVNWKW